MSKLTAKTAAEERQLKPIYDALDNGNAKAALQSCNKHLKKNPKWQLIIALKALCLVRSGKFEEANHLVSGLVNQKPTDETTISILSHSLKPLDRPLDLIGIYQHAWDVAPKSEEMGAQTFVAHVRTGRWSGARLTGTKLWKAFNIERYLWWSIIAAVMQAERPFPPSPIPVLVMIPTRAQLAEREAALAKDKVLSKEVLYGLAWRMAGTAPKESVLTPERIWLQASVAIRSAKHYEGLGKEKEAKEMWAEALKVLESDAGQRASATALHVEELRREIVAKSAQWDSEYGRMKERLEKGDRNWLTYITLLDSLFELESKPTEEHTNAESNEANGVTGKPGVEDVRRLFKALSQTDEEKAPSERASRLAVLELESRLRKAGKPSGDFIRLVTQYWERFSLKPVVVEDLLDFVKALEGEERAQWDAFIDAIPEDVSSVDHLQTTINKLKMQRLTTTTIPTPADEEALAKKYLALYTAALPLDAGLPAESLHPADDLGVLAGSVLISAYDLSLSQSYLYIALIVLEKVTLHSKWCYPARLLLVRLNRLLAAPSLAVQHYHNANLKGVQSDTLGHHLLSHAHIFALGSAGDIGLINECVEASQVYTVNQNETSDQIVKAFQWEKYSQIPEMCILDDRLDNSFQRELTKMEHLRMKVLYDGLSVESVEIELVELRYMFNRDVFGTGNHDNRDLGLIPNYLLGGADIEKVTSVSGRTVSKTWFNVWTKLYFQCIHLASEQLYTEKERSELLPQLTIDAETLAGDDLTPAERKLVEFGLALVQWLEPHHIPIKHTVMTNAVAALEAAKAAPLKKAETAGKKGGTKKATNGATSTENGTGEQLDEHGFVVTGGPKVPTGMLTLQEPVDVPPIPEGLAERVRKEPPEDISTFFDDFQKLFEETVANADTLPWEVLHIAQLTHEAVFFVHCLTARFAMTASKKKTFPTYKPLRARALTALSYIAGELTKLAEAIDATEQGRKTFIAEQKASAVLVEIPDSHVLTTTKALFEARKKHFETLAKGLNKAVTVVAKQAAGAPPLPQ